MSPGVFLGAGLIVAGIVVFLGHVPLGSALWLPVLPILAGSLLTARSRGRSPGSLRWPFAGGILLLPARLFYWDRWDLEARAGNLLLLVLIISCVLAWKEFRLGRRLLFAFQRLGLRRRSAVIFLVCELVFVLASAVIADKGIRLVGDEPHYLVIAHSLARDRDLNVFNQYARDEYREFTAHRLRPHARVGQGFKRWFSFHLPGLSFTLAPFFLLRLPAPLLVFLIRCYLGLFASLLAVLIHSFCLRLWGRRNLALLVTLFVIFTGPIFFMSFHIFAEVQALLLILLSLYLLLGTREATPLKTLLAGFFLGLSVFWGMKYLIFSILYAVGFSLWFMRRGERRRAVLFVAFPLFFLCLFFLYLFLAYGNLSPMSVYTGVLTDAQEKAYYDGVKQTGWKIRLETLLGYFLDQRDGLLLYSPFYFFFFPGLLLALRRFRRFRPFILVSLPALVYLAYHGYSTVRPGVCPQARYLVPVIWALMLFSVLYYLNSDNRFFRWLWRILPLYSLFVVVYQLLHPLTLYQTTTHDFLHRPGLMFQQWSNLVLNLPDWLPSFVKLPHNERHLANPLFLVVLTVLAVLALGTAGPMRGLRRGLVAAACCGFVSLFVLFPRITFHNPLRVDGEAGAAHVIYGHSLHPAQAREKVFRVDRGESLRVTASTMRRSDTWTLRIHNAGTRDSLLEVYAFDERLARLDVAAGQSRTVDLNGVASRRIRGRFVHQFTLTGEARGRIVAPQEVEIFPRRRSRDTSSASMDTARIGRGISRVRFAEATRVPAARSRPNGENNP